MRDALDVDRLLAGAAKAVKSVRYCWLLTAAEGGGVRTRPMGRLLHDKGEPAHIIGEVVEAEGTPCLHIAP